MTFEIPLFLVTKEINRKISTSRLNRSHFLHQFSTDYAIQIILLILLYDGKCLLLTTA